MLSPGDVLSDRYRLHEPIASGGMGEVWQATDVSLGRAVAVKILRPTLTDPSFDVRFRAEARMMAGLTHHNIVNVYDYGHSALADGTSVSYLVMAYVDGQSLLQRIRDAGRLSVAETMSIVAQAADALHAAHLGGIVHRDVKPANLLVQPNGTVILVDFGVARSPSVTGVTTADGLLGTATYMAPEQASGRPISPATDIYALGIVAYHCLAGHPPYSGGGALEVALRQVYDEPPPLPDDLPPAVRALTMRALAKDPADRYPTAAEFAAAARAVTVRRGAVLSAVAPDAVNGSSRRRPGRLGLAVSGTALALLLGIVGLIAFLGSSRPASTEPIGPPGVAPATPDRADPAGDPAGSHQGDPAGGNGTGGKPAGGNGTGGNPAGAIPAGVPSATGSSDSTATPVPSPSATAPPTQAPGSAAPTVPPPPSTHSTPSPPASPTAESTPSAQATHSPPATSPPPGNAATTVLSATVAVPPDVP